jgi:hypothetical protein
VGLVRLGEPVGVRLETGRELPGQPWDVAVDQRWLWVATTHGLVRFRREAVER